jgi:LuxR family maltose regulon positive regulatory protein
MLASLDSDAAAQSRLGDRVTCLTLIALGHQAAGDADAARASLSEAIRLGSPEGFARTFLDEGPAIADLLRAVAATRGPETLYAQRLRAAFGKSGPASGSPAALPLAEPLSEREREVLRLLAEGRSIEDVAERLIISVHTARTHVRNVYAKLDAHNRAQAIRNATVLRLI